MPDLPFRNWLFDFDGTLVDSSPLHDASYRQAIDEHMPELAARFRYDQVKGKPTLDAFVELGASEAKRELLTAAKQRAYRDLVAQQLAPFSGASELLNTLASCRGTRFLVTSGSRGSVTAALTHTGLARYFNGVITADDVHLGKPAPDPYLRCMESFELDPAACVAVEDAPSGVISARQAGIAVLGVNDSSISRIVDQFFPTLSELNRWILQLSSRETSVP